MVTVVSFGMGKLPTTVFRHLPFHGVHVDHKSPFMDCEWHRFESVFRQPLTRESLRGAASGLRLDFGSPEEQSYFQDDPRIVCRKSSLAFDSPRMAHGFLPWMPTVEWVDVCRSDFVRRVDEVFDIMESDREVLFFLYFDPPSDAQQTALSPQAVYNRLASRILKMNPMAKRSFYFMSSAVESDGIVRRAPRFFTMPCRPRGFVTRDVAVSLMPDIVSMLRHFEESIRGL